MGVAVMAKCRTFLRSCASTTRTNRTRNVTVGTVKKPMATSCYGWLRTSARHVCEGGLRSPFGRYLQTVAAETWRPSFASSARIRGLPQVGLARHIRRIRSIKSRSISARLERRREFQRQKSQYLLAGLIDELHLAISPLFLGRGENLFAGLDPPQLGYQRTEHLPSPHMTHVVFTKRATWPRTLDLKPDPCYGDPRAAWGSPDNPRPAGR
jgi:hypothetical protein